MAWIGCYEVRAKPGSELHASGMYGAFVNVVVDCESEAEFREKASDALMEDRYQLLDVEDVMFIDLADTDTPKDELDLLNSQLTDGNKVAYGTFQAYPKDGLDA
tara:strand:+ start:90 stop:401 length:312 start_codon:yes stop_codon:yes gene_type:complete